MDSGPNPIEFITHTTGDWTIRFLVITLAITPLRKLLNLPHLIRFRRMFGLFAFFYAFLHFTTCIGLDQFFAWSDMWRDVLKRRLSPRGSRPSADDPAGDHLDCRIDSPVGRQALATDPSRHLRAAILGVIHYYWLVKSDDASRSFTARW